MMEVRLIAYTPNPESVVSAAAHICYSDKNVDDLLEEKTSKRRIRDLRGKGHLSPFEHISFTFAVDGATRALLAQVTRHRLASFSVRSQRYVDHSSFEYAIPRRIRALGDEYVSKFKSQMETISGWYNDWLSVVGKEDARAVLPSAATTNFIVTMNARELLHFCSLRCCNKAQDEIQSLAWAMLRLAKDVAPTVFEMAGPPCVRGACPEGKNSCGHPYPKAGV